MFHDTKELHIFFFSNKKKQEPKSHVTRYLSGIAFTRLLPDQVREVFTENKKQKSKKANPAVAKKRERERKGDCGFGGGGGGRGGFSFDGQ